jgi:hypothetical protein
MFIKKSFRFIQLLLARYPSDDKVRAVHEYLSKESIGINNNGSTNIVAVQGVENPFFYSLFGMIILDLKRRTKVSARLIFIRSFDGGIGDGLRVAVMRSNIVGWFISSQWARVNCNVVGEVGYRSQSFDHLLGDFLDLFRAYKIWCRLK